MTGDCIGFGVKPFLGLSFGLDGEAQKNVPGKPVNHIRKANGRYSLAGLTVEDSSSVETLQSLTANPIEQTN